MESRNQFKYKSNPLGGIIGLMIVLGILYMLFLTVKGVWSILYFLAPILFIITLVINRKVVFDYGKMLLNKIKTDTVKGLVYTGLSIIGFPVVSAFLFFKAFAMRKVEQMTKPKFDEYEEVPEESEAFLELPELEIDKKTRSSNSNNEYEDLFE